MTVETRSLQAAVIDQAVNPQGPSITKEHIFSHDIGSLTTLGSTIQGIKINLELLEHVWKEENPTEFITQDRQNEMIEEIACRLTEVADGLDFEPDTSLIPSIISQYDKYSDDILNQ